ncbi:nuclear protein DGCR14 [Sphaerosporella brunnea]|uniref:Nuclear protein DGCR14 n=1 Tax=Sphaerosporella brunnea TaxID=1250544 RepID=A0A5J5F3T6_9PEZI|nr:nuclear protein DGCR14 [Sphaerosporella brunnea]
MASTTAGASSALIRKPTDTELMPPPPLKRIKRPPKVLDEDSYTDALSEIIARDFFPGLYETKYQQEYLDAIESQDSEWIEDASRKLTEVMTTPQHRRRGTSFQTPQFRDSSATPALGSTPVLGSATPAKISGEKEKKKMDTSLSLDAFQSKYTSEDNESFNTLLDKQNEKRRNAYAFLWNGNRIPGFRTQAHQKRLKAQAEAQEEGPQKLLVAPDDRPAIPNTWKAEPRNSLMFIPDTSSPPPEKSDLPPKSVVYANTRMPPPSAVPPERPASPSASLIADAIAGRPRPPESEADFGFRNVETPRVNGYSFVDAAPSPSPESLGAPPLTWGSVAAVSDTAPAPSPFKIAATPKRELLHHRMVEKVAKGKRTTNRPGTPKTPGMSGGRMTTQGGGGKGREIPKFGSSPALTPAGQRLWGNLTGRGEAGLRESILKGTSTPKAGGRGFRWDPTPRADGK